jgi:hypothetical protein
MRGMFDDDKPLATFLKLFPPSTIGKKSQHVFAPA